MRNCSGSTRCTAPSCGARWRIRREGRGRQVAREGAVARAKDYFGLADHYINHFQKPFNPVVFMGLSGIEPSTIARVLTPTP